MMMSMPPVYELAHLPRGQERLIDRRSDTWQMYADLELCRLSTALTFVVLMLYAPTRDIFLTRKLFLNMDRFFDHVEKVTHAIRRLIFGAEIDLLDLLTRLPAYHKFEGTVDPASIGRVGCGSIYRADDIVHWQRVATVHTYMSLLVYQWFDRGCVLRAQAAEQFCNDFNRTIGRALGMSFGSLDDLHQEYWRLQRDVFDIVSKQQQHHESETMPPRYRPTLVQIIQDVLGSPHLAELVGGDDWAAGALLYLLPPGIQRLAAESGMLPAHEDDMPHNAADIRSGFAERRIFDDPRAVAGDDVARIIRQRL
jgi:hypothetical protein